MWKLNKFNPTSVEILILNTIEFYMSDEFLVRSKFLVSQISRNSLGYISLKLLASFRSLSDLITDFDKLRHVISYSSVLSLSNDSLKVKRKIPVPKEIINYHKTMLNLAIKWFIVITNIPDVDTCSINSFDLISNVLFKLNLIINNILIHWENDEPNSLMTSYMKSKNHPNTTTIFIQIKKNLNIQSVFTNWSLINTFNMNIDLFKAKEMQNKNILQYNTHNPRKNS